MLAEQVGESVNQLKRYIRLLTNLIPKILDMVDEEKIAFTVIEINRCLIKSIVSI
jgi:ParB family transcriptional regulator, chromosome partitioning protein